MKAMIFAAGLGTRLRPLTDTLPKALVPVGGAPLLYHVLMKLKAAGITEFVINVHHFADKIVSYLEENDRFGMDISISDETDGLLETGGGILHARQFLDGPFLVHNVDILSNLDVASFIGKARPEALATLLVSDRQTSRYLLFDDDMRLKGWTNISTGEVRSPYPDLDPASCRKLAFSGIHLVSDKIFDAFGEYGFSGRFPIMDFYLKACRDCPVYGAVQPGLELMDVGKTDTLAQAEEFLKSSI
ncbi:MAG: nucleotidyltransferase family protein [Bacteroidales bacterium]|nr:nucleotidyltransferase family protein [Bacteroidales bacterium]MBP5740306.1 nucleotidyltransferase family protein [Bacteroidales bacterium]MBQ3996485.1 nucleotidyltransferase family protein [Bacteroidales bacterium]MBR6362549.1 nucleotidyltransferase family protein [Bacteroidales bacterium]